MLESSLEELKRRIAAGDYPIDSGKLAETIRWKIGLIRRVGRSLASNGDEAVEAGRGPRSRNRRGSRSSPSHPSRSHRERFS
jgi:hypothetical protein